MLLCAAGVLLLCRGSSGSIGFKYFCGFNFYLSQHHITQYGCGCQPLTLNCQSTQVGDLLSKDPCDLNLSLEFWSPVETSGGGGPGRIQRRAPQRQLSLFNFIRLCSDLLPALLFSPFMHMLTGLCNSVKTAHHGFNFLKANSPSLGMPTRTPCM